MTLPPVHKLWVLDLLDISLVAVLFYRLLILVKGTRSAQMYVGLLIIVLVGVIAREFDLIAVRWIVDSLKTVSLIAFVILFQPRLAAPRRGRDPARGHRHRRLVHPAAPLESAHLRDARHPASRLARDHRGDRCRGDRGERGDRRDLGRLPRAPEAGAERGRAAQ